MKLLRLLLMILTLGACRTNQELKPIHSLLGSWYLESEDCELSAEFIITLRGDGLTIESGIFTISEHVHKITTSFIVYTESQITEIHMFSDKGIIMVKGMFVSPDYNTIESTHTEFIHNNASQIQRCLGTVTITKN